MSTGDFVARNAKTVVSVLGGVIAVGGAASALFAYAPADVAGAGTGLLAVLEVLRAVNVWIVKNEPTLETAADDGATAVAALNLALHGDPAAALEKLKLLEAQRVAKAAAYQGTASSGVSG